MQMVQHLYLKIPKLQDEKKIRYFDFGQFLPAFRIPLGSGFLKISTT